MTVKLRILVLAGLVAFSAAPSAQTGLATYKFTAPGLATFGINLPQGKVTGALKVGALPTQTDVKTRHADGSINHAIVTAKIPQAGSLPITADAVQSGSLTPTWPSSSVTIVVTGGPTYVAALPAFTGTDSFLNGPLVRESRATVVPVSGSIPHSFLRVLYDVRSYEDGQHALDVTVSSALNVPNNQSVGYSITVTLNGQTVYSKTNTTTPGKNPITASNGGRHVSAGHGLSVGDSVRLMSGPQPGKLFVVKAVHDADTFDLNYGVEVPLPVSWERLTFCQPSFTRFTVSASTAGFTAANWEPDLTPAQQAGAIPTYRPTVNDTTYSTSGPMFEPFRLGHLTHPLNAPGGRPELGPYPRWTAQYLVHQDDDQKAYMLANAGNVAGAVSVHFDDPSTGVMVLLDQRPDWLNLQVDPTGATGLAKAGGVNTHILFNPEVGAAHTPGLSYIPYLLTGKRIYLDELKYWANGSMLTVGWMRERDKGLLIGQQIRALGWGMRDLSDAASAIPDGDPHKAYFASKVRNNVEALNRMQAAERDPLGASTFGEPPDVLGQLFQQVYAAWGFHHAMRHGFPEIHYVKRISSYWLKMFQDPGFQKPYILSYQFAWNDLTPPTFTPFASFAQMFDYNLNRRPFQPWKNFGLPPLAGGVSYNKQAYLLGTVMQDLKLPGANDFVAWVLSGVDGSTTTLMDLNLESEFALMPAPSTTTPVPTPPQPVQLVITEKSNATASCRVTLSAQPPDKTTGWKVQFRRGTTNFGTADASAPYERTSTVSGGSHSMTGVWTKTGAQTQTTAPLTVQCQ